MSKKLLITLAWLTISSAVFPTSDPFYLNLLNEGKVLYQAGKYDEALEDFKIAEFGLVDEKEIVTELYFYYALAQYKKGAFTESKSLLEKMKLALGGVDIDKLPKPKDIEGDLSIMVRALNYLGQPGANPGSLPFFSLFYETWDLVKAKKMAEAEANLKRLAKMGGDDARLAFLQGFFAFQQGEYKQCIKALEKMFDRLDGEFSQDASFFLAYSFLKGADLANSEKYAKNIKDGDYIHRLMVLMDEIKAAQTAKNKKK